MTEFKLLQGFREFINFFKFKRIIKHEFYTRNSKFNKFELKTNWIGNIIYAQKNFTDRDLMEADYNPQKMVDKWLKPMVMYISGELGFGDCLLVDVGNFVDEDNNPSLSYAVEFEYVGYVFTFKKLAKVCAILGSLIAAGIVALCLLK